MGEAGGRSGSADEEARSDALDLHAMSMAGKRLATTAAHEPISRNEIGDGNLSHRAA